ncbi:MAG: hypothetical protein LBH94_07485 [Deltaproteobacteria bacterium]|nr:hypothetical protein [Deltaproteobacteria bacterium]
MRLIKKVDPLFGMAATRIFTPDSGRASLSVCMYDLVFAGIGCRRIGF